MFTKLTVKTGEFSANVSFGDVGEFVPPNSVREFEGTGDVTYQVDELEEGQAPHVDLPFTPPAHIDAAASEDLPGVGTVATPLPR